MDSSPDYAGYTAPQLYAVACGSFGKGPVRCHWCGGPCERVIPHDDPRPLPGTRSTSTAKIPGSPYQCVGCWHWRKRRITVLFLAGGYKDGQSPADHSWLITPDAARVVRDGDRTALLRFLLAPTRPFALAFKTEGPNPLHLAPVNPVKDLRADSELRYCVGGLELRYTVFELDYATKAGPDGTAPGVRMLHELLGIVRSTEIDPELPKPDATVTPIISVEPEARRAAGRPPALINRARQIVRSGA